MGRLQDRVALVTGAASGIGRASAKLFASEGAKVVVFDRAPAIEETAEAIRAAGGEAIALTGDAGDEADVAKAVQTALEKFGGLDICYANAGVATMSMDPPLEQTGEQWLALLRINLVGPYLAIKHASKPMREKGKGSIICTASVAGLRSGAGGPAYSASKAGVINLVQTTAQLLSGTGVRVNAICPGLIETGMTKPVFDRARAKGTEDRIGQLNPLKRAGVPEEIAGAALFLASDDASYVNGQAIVVDGGLSSSHPIVISRRGE
jgi:NAD(P)-dependent dehydrogenase (short-subunit alcohol dehydrogenase family)